MREFFRGRKRKVGAATLVIACTAICLWLRSIAYSDALSVQGVGQKQEFIFTRGEVHWIIREGLWNVEFDWRTWPSTSAFANKNLVAYLIGSKQYAKRPEDHTHVWNISLLPLAVSLTLLSAYLLLSKAPEIESKKLTERILSEGA